jgi:hypothetical protein
VIQSWFTTTFSLQFNSHAQIAHNVMRFLVESIDRSHVWLNLLQWWSDRYIQSTRN